MFMDIILFIVNIVSWLFLHHVSFSFQFLGIFEFFFPQCLLLSCVQSALLSCCLSLVYPVSHVPMSVSPWSKCQACLHLHVYRASCFVLTVSCPVYSVFSFASPLLLSCTFKSSVSLCSLFFHLLCVSLCSTVPHLFLVSEFLYVCTVEFNQLQQ